MWKLLAVVLMTLGIASAEEVHPTLALGSPAPDFALCIGRRAERPVDRFRRL